MFGCVGMVLYYKFCYILGGMFDFFYVDIYVIILLYVIVYNVCVVVDELVLIIEVLGGENVGWVFYDFGKLFGVLLLLKLFGVIEVDLDYVVDFVV